MIKISLKSVCFMVFCLALTASATLSAGTSHGSNAYDTIELKSGDTLTGTVLNDTFTVMTPYTSMTLEKGDISEIRMDSGSENQDVIVLTTGGLMEGTIEERTFSFKPTSGETISLEKERCKHIILKKSE